MNDVTNGNHYIHYADYHCIANELDRSLGGVWLRRFQYVFTAEPDFDKMKMALKDTVKKAHEARRNRGTVFGRMFAEVEVDGNGNLTGKARLWDIVALPAEMDDGSKSEYAEEIQAIQAEQQQQRDALLGASDGGSVTRVVKQPAAAKKQPPGKQPPEKDSDASSDQKSPAKKTPQDADGKRGRAGGASNDASRS